jgi:hypothetical protein
MVFIFTSFVPVLVTWMSFASGARELRRDALTMLEIHIVMSSLISPRSYSHAPPRFYSRASPRTSSCALTQFAHEPNNRSYGFG